MLHASEILAARETLWESKCEGLLVFPEISLVVATIGRYQLTLRREGELAIGEDWWNLVDLEPGLAGTRFRRVGSWVGLR